MEKMTECNRCGEGFTDKDSFRKHTKKWKRNCQSRNCDSCGKECRGKLELRNHKIRSNGQCKMKCHFCDKMFKVIEEYKMEDKNCGICNKDLTTKKKLEHHEKKTHGDRTSRKPSQPRTTHLRCKDCRRNFKKRAH